MPLGSVTSSINSWSRLVENRGRAAATLLLLAPACLGLLACGSSSSAESPSGEPSSVRVASANAHPSAAARRHELAKVRDLLRCARRHGLDIPEPSASGHVDTRRVDLKSARSRATLASCYRVIEGKANAGS
jgi:hypothetical protein